MSHGPANPFEPLEPPRGGLAALRARIERDSAKRVRRRRRLKLAVATTAPLVVLATLLAVRLQPRAPLPDGILWARIAAGIDAAPAEPLTVASGHEGSIAVRRVPTSTDLVVFYLVDSLNAGSARTPQAPRDPRP